MKLELKYNRIQKKEGNNKRRKIYIYNFSPRREKKNNKLIHAVESGTEVRRFPSFPPIPMENGGEERAWKRKRKEFHRGGMENRGP